MENGGAVGGGVMLALAAGLWLVYLVPSWLRRREYLATELNAVRLQQTLRVLAATAEVPEPVHVETTARSVAAQQRALKQQQAVTDAAERAREAAAARTAARQQAAVQPAIAAVVTVRSLAARRLRRTRVATSLVLLAALVTLVVQGVLMILTGIAPAAPVVLAFAGVGAVTSLALLGRLNSVSRARTAAALAPPSKVARRTSLDPYEQPAVPVARKDWTPVPVPKPLYLSRTTLDQPAFDVAAAVADLQAAAARSDAALRAAHASPGVSPIRAAAPAPSPAAEPVRTERPASRFASMGIVDPAAQGTPDLDAMLRRRRAAG